MHSFNFNVGDIALIGVPCGMFTPQLGNACLISAGIGITPMLSFYRHFGCRVKKVLQIFRNKEV